MHEAQAGTSFAKARADERKPDLGRLAALASAGAKNPDPSAYTSVQHSKANDAGTGGSVCADRDIPQPPGVYAGARVVSVNAENTGDTMGTNIERDLTHEEVL